MPRPPRCIQVMKRGEPSLNISAGPHLLGRSEQYPYTTGVHSVEEQFLRYVTIGVMDKRDLACGDARSDELRTDIVINVESSRIRDR